MPDGLAVIYFLFLNDKIVYVGKSVTFLTRLATHIMNKRGQFNRVAYICVPKEYITDIERAYILKFNPELNQAFFQVRPLKIVTEESACSEMLRPLAAAKYISAKFGRITPDRLKLLAKSGLGPITHRRGFNSSPLYLQIDLDVWGPEWQKRREALIAMAKKGMGKL